MCNKTRNEKYVLVVDPAVHTPERECFEKVQRLSSRPCEYFLPALDSKTGPQQVMDLNSLSALLIFGSACSVYENRPWQKEFIELLWEAIEKRVPIFGFCYGHQLLAHMYGGDVKSMEGPKALGTRPIEVFSENRWEFEGQEGILVVSHQEVVTQCPDTMKVWAQSSQVPIDGLIHKELPIWTLQAHPEAGPEFIENRGWPKATVDQIYEGADVFSFGDSLIQQFLQFSE